ncbi:MAG: ABC transporter substrate-binding protein [Acidobacteriota bacterium]|nr:ABC transporter substrate-binding protein [Acidobacteriota bacterium]
MLRYSTAVFALAASLAAQTGGELRFCLRSEPKTFDPALVSDESSVAIRYLTGGVLIRVNRLTQELEPELATRWKVSELGRRIDFTLRTDARFSDGTPFSCEDVAYTIRRLMDPALHSPTGDEFRTAPGEVETKCSGSSAMLRFPAPIAALATLFDGVAIQSAHSPKKDAAVLGPFAVAEYKPGTHILLRRNPNYWKHDAQGKPLPYVDSVRLDIQQNRETELLRFRRGEVDLIEKLDPEMYDRLAAEMPKSVADAGASLDWELVFFNQAAGSPLPAYKQRWFQSAAFRRAVSEAINRDDLCKVVYRGHARPAAGPVSPSNRFWQNAALKPHAFSTAAALARLKAAGFKMQGDTLVDSEGHRVEFSMVTNAGNKLHERMLAMIQQDLARIGVRLNVAALDFPSLIERITRTYDYESCLMAFANIHIDPNEQMNVWVSSAANHPWNPSQKQPATAWEAEMDRLMRAQAAALDPKKRKAYFDDVQRIVWEEAPMLFLVHPNTLSAVSSKLRNTSPSAVRPAVYWNAERLSLGPPQIAAR